MRESRMCAEKAPDAAAAMGVTADNILKLGLIDEIIAEPIGGAHRDLQASADALRDALASHLHTLQRKPIDEIVAERYQRLRAIGQT